MKHAYAISTNEAYLIDEDHSVVATWELTMPDREDEKGEIVRACNSFDDLLTACELVDAAFDDLFAGATPQYRLIGQRVRVALKKARGE